MNVDIRYIGMIEDDSALDTEQIVIFGAGKLGKRVLEFLESREKKNNVCAFCDSNEELWGKKISGIEVLSIRDAVKRYGNKTFLLTGVAVHGMLGAVENRKVHIICN